jgi:hypothetical protein
VLLSLAAGAAPAEDSYDIKVYPCPEAAEAISVDGLLGEPAWQAAPLVTGFTWYNKPELVPVQGYLRVVYDDEAVYFAVTCDEPNLGKLVPVRQARDAHAVFDGETIEIFVDPKHDGNYYQFAASAAASVWDSHGSDATWNAGILAGAQIDTGRHQWTLEMAIPWRDLGLEPRAGAVVGFNVCRDRHLGTAREWSNWAQTQANFHDPERFAHLVLSPTPEQLARLAPEFRKGDRRGRLVIYSAEGYANTSYLAMARASLREVDRRLGELGRLARRQADPATRLELARRLKGYREEVSPYHEQIRSEEGIDAAAWMRIDLRADELKRELGQVLWEAKLAALLGGI